jgi:hypothetical protein
MPLDSQGRIAQLSYEKSSTEQKSLEKRLDKSSEVNNRSIHWQHTSAVFQIFLRWEVGHEEPGSWRRLPSGP